jgi:hypothetical protein
MKEYTVN